MKFLSPNSLFVFKNSYLRHHIYWVSLRFQLIHSLVKNSKVMLYFAGRGGCHPLFFTYDCLMRYLLMLAFTFNYMFVCHISFTEHLCKFFTHIDRWLYTWLHTYVNDFVYIFLYAH